MKTQSISANNWQAYAPDSAEIVLVGPMAHPPLHLPQNCVNLPQVAVDGGIHAAEKAFLWAGDGDSGFVPHHIPAFYKQDQDMTDLDFCLRGMAGWSWEVLHLFGFGGGRRDHELANLGTLHAQMKARPAFLRAFIYNAPLRQVPASGAPQLDAANAPSLPAIQATSLLNKGTHDVWIDGLFSVLALETARVSLSGACRYPADNLLLSPLSGRGVSNRGGGDIHLVTDSPLILLQSL